MSDTTDDIEHYRIPDEFEDEELHFTWKIKNGQEIKIWDMDNNHLLNVQKYLLENDEYHIFIEYEIARRGLK